MNAETFIKKPVAIPSTKDIPKVIKRPPIWIPAYVSFFFVLSVNDLYFSIWLSVSKSLINIGVINPPKILKTPWIKTTLKQSLEYSLIN